jgi:TonB family protein
MYFDFEDGRPDLQRVPSGFTVREGVMATLIVHLTALLLIVLAPQMPFFKARAAAARAEARRLAMLQPHQNQTFVFVQPRVELNTGKPSPTAPASDRDRAALTRERAPNPKNLQPFSRGNSPEYVQQSPPPTRDRMARQPGPPAPSPTDQNSQPAQTASTNPGTDALRLPNSMTQTPAAHQGTASGRPATGPLSEALRNLSRYAEQAAFDNPNGGQNGAFGPAIQFDTKGVEFGPWIRRFIAQVKRNWLVPQAAMSLRGHVVITFNVHKNGSLTELSVVGPSSVDSFNNAAFGALAASNPTEPLPPEYPTDKAFFTVTFYYNERVAEGP